MLAAGLCSGCLSALASDPVGLYALIDKVVLEPNAQSPERIQVWGVFALAKGRGYEYEQAKRGWVYYKLNPEKPDVCRKEWADLKSVAGQEQAVGFGSRYQERGRLRKESDKPETPDVYPLGFGVTKVRRTDYEPIKDLFNLKGTKPKEASPKKSTRAFQPSQFVAQREVFCTAATESAESPL